MAGGRLEVVSQFNMAEEAAASSSGLDCVFQRFGLSGAETWTLTDAGFDSLKMVEFCQALKESSSCGVSTICLSRSTCGCCKASRSASCSPCSSR